ncbi:uncharacterized protein LOC144438495 [Glandiceps talaboti]
MKEEMERFRQKFEDEIRSMSEKMRKAEHEQQRQPVVVINNNNNVGVPSSVECLTDIAGHRGTTQGMNHSEKGCVLDSDIDSGLSRSVMESDPDETKAPDISNLSTKRP